MKHITVAPRRIHGAVSKTGKKKKFFFDIPFGRPDHDESETQPDNSNDEGESK